MKYAVVDDTGKPLDAHFELDGTTVILHSRGGTKGKNARNTDYEAALRLLLARITSSKLAIAEVLVDSKAVKALPPEQREVLFPGEARLPFEQIYGRIAARMKKVGQDPSSIGGNATKRLSIKLAGTGSPQTVLEVLEAGSARLPAAQLGKVTAEDLLYAAEQLLAGAQHAFGPSTDYDVLLDTGERLPPKAVFGLAATRALGFTVRPGHFTGGIDSPCFKALAGAGYVIVEKGAPPPQLVEGDDKEWSEGTPQLRAHMRKERGSGLAAAKRVEFRRVHGRLFCELCKMDPVKEYKDLSGEACIEVHHAATEIQHMKPGHRTKLTDLQCICASCHRVVHRRLKTASADAIEA